MRGPVRDVGVFFAGLVAGVVLALLVPFVIDKINALVPDNEGPLDYATIVDPEAPTSISLTEAIERLDATATATWQLRLLEDTRTTFDKPTLTPAAAAALAPRVRVPNLDPKLVALATNLDSPESVRQNGVFYLLYFSGPSRAKDWLWEDPTIFTDDATDRARSTYQAGPVVVYYANTGEVDHTQEIRRYVGELVRCPTEAGPCPE